MQFQNFDIAAFLQDYWQKQPLLIRNPWQDWHDPLEAEELAGLACEEGAETRLIVQTPGGPQLEHGPLSAKRLAKLGGDPWTMLVQAADHLLPEVAALIEPFRFIPNWRIDDVMVSYASDGGGVGPHYDQYDVFLVQGAGRRRWQIGAKCSAETPLLPHDDLRLIADFQPLEEWVLESGDILYVPPLFAHNGVAVGDGCMTYSVGFRAPSRSELIGNWAEQLVDDLPEDDRFADPDLKLQTNPGEIAPAAIAALHTLVTERMNDSEQFARWFGEFSTAPKYPEIDWRPEELVSTGEVSAALAAGRPLLRNPASRFSYIHAADASVVLFADGASFDCGADAAALAQAVCAHDRVEAVSGLASSPAALELLTGLINQGSVAFEQDD